jgi:hypothetical protein
MKPPWRRLANAATASRSVTDALFVIVNIPPGGGSRPDSTAVR